MRRARGVLVVVVLLWPRVTAAQTAAPAPETPRFFVDVNLFGSASSLAETRGFTALFLSAAEVGSLQATYPKPSRATMFPLLDIGGGFMFMRSLGVGVNYSRTVYDDAVDLAATIPHPTFLNASASDTGVTADELTREEASANVFLVLVPLQRDRAELRVFGGPSFFFYDADMVDNILYSQDYDPLTPANSITITGATSREVSGSAIGFHLGGDFTYFFTTMFGVTGGVRFSRATVTVDEEPLSKLSQEIRVGGTLVFLGVRARFGG